MNIFTRKKVLLAANRKLVHLLFHEKTRDRRCIERLIAEEQQLEKQIEELKSKVKEPLRIILVDERSR